MSYKNNKQYYIIALLFSIIILGVVVAFSSIVGPAKIGILEYIRIIVRKIPLISSTIIANGSINETHSLIILNIRLPRIILAGLVGSGLSIVGAAFQSIFKNPMADPYILGTSSGASLGAAIAMMAGLQYSLAGWGGLAFIAFIASVATMLIVSMISKQNGRISPDTLLLTGISVSFLLSSITSNLLLLDSGDALKIMFWSMGSFVTANWIQVFILLPIILIGSGIILCFSRELNIMSLGEYTAKSLGVETEFTKNTILAVSIMIVAICVSVSGVIGFVGFIIPHIARLMISNDYRMILPFSITLGAIFMIISDTVARTLFSFEIPVGSITSIFGVPYFIYLIIKNRV